MSFEGTFTPPTGAAGTNPSGARGRTSSARPAGPSWLSLLSVAALVVVVLAGSALAWVKLTGGQRNAAAVRHMVSAEQAFWQAQASPPAGGAADGKKKKRKAAATKAKPASFGLDEGMVPAAMLKDKYTLASLKQDNERLNAVLATFSPSDINIIIDTANNHLYLKRKQEVLMDAVCSTGSYAELKADDGRSWFFHTPRGKFKVQRKIKDPVWIKPDWGFVEEGEPIPGARHESRYEPYVMGKYALAFGNGYYIHGTLYRRLLGQSVTHGCVRLGDEELENVFNTAPVGTPIFIY